MKLAVIKIPVSRHMDCIASVYSSVEDAVKAIDTVLGKYLNTDLILRGNENPVKAIIKTVADDGTVNYAVNYLLGDYVCDNRYEDLQEEFREDLDKLFKKHASGIIDEIIVSEIEIGVPFNNYDVRS